MAELKIVIDEKGNITSHTTGVKGSKCLAVDDFLEHFGETAVEKTSEYYEDAEEKVVLIRPGQ